MRINLNQCNSLFRILFIYSILISINFQTTALGQGKMITFWPSLSPDWMLSPFLNHTNNSNQKLWYMSQFIDSINSTSTGYWYYTDSFKLHGTLNSCLISPQEINIYAIQHGSPSTQSILRGDSIKQFLITYLNGNNYIDSAVYIDYDTINNNFDTVSRRVIEYNIADSSVIEYRYISFGGYLHKVRLNTVFYKGNHFEAEYPVLYDTLLNQYDTFFCKYYKYDSLNRVTEVGLFGVDTIQRNKYFYSNGLLERMEVVAPVFLGNDSLYITYEYSLPFYIKHQYYKYFSPISIEHKILEKGRLYPNLLLDTVWNFYDDHGINLYALSKYKYDKNGFLTDYYIHYFDTNGIISPYGDSLIYRYKYENPQDISQIDTKETFVQIYPNPCSEFILIYFESTDDKIDYAYVINEEGKFIQKNLINIHHGTNLEKLNMATLKPGIYFIMIGSTTKKVIKL